MNKISKKLGPEKKPYYYRRNMKSTDQKHIKHVETKTST